MSRSEEFHKGVVRSQQWRSQGGTLNRSRTSSSDDDPGDPGSGTDSPAWQELLGQSEQRSSRFEREQSMLPQSEQWGRGNYANQGHGPSGNVTSIQSGGGLSPVQRQYLEEHQQAGGNTEWSSGTGWSDLVHNAGRAQAIVNDTIHNAIEPVSHAVSEAVHGRANISPQTAEHIQNVVNAPANTVNADNPNSVPRQIARDPAGAAEYLWEGAGGQALWDLGKAAATDPLGAMENVGNAAQFAVAHPKQLWHATQRVVPAVVRHYKENPGELLQMGVGTALTAGLTMGAGALVNAGLETVQGAATAARTARGVAEVAEVAEGATQAGRAATVADVAGTAGRVGAGSADELLGRATSMEEMLTQAAGTSGRTSAEMGTTSVARRTGTVSAEAAEREGGIGYRLLQKADRTITRTDEAMGRYIGLKEDVRNWSHNLPRRALGMEEKDLRLGLADRFSQRIADRVAGGPGAEGSESSARQIIASRISPTRREMPELPEGVSNFARRNIEKNWRRSAFEEVRPNGLPTSSIRRLEKGVEFAENPTGFIMDRVLGSLNGGDDLRRSTAWDNPWDASAAGSPMANADTKGFYQRSARMTPPRATAYRGTSSTVSSAPSVPSNYGPAGSYEPGRGWRSANSSMYQDEQEPLRASIPSIAAAR